MRLVDFPATLSTLRTPQGILVITQTNTIGRRLSLPQDQSGRWNDKLRKRR